MLNMANLLWAPFAATTWSQPRPQFPLFYRSTAPAPKQLWRFVRQTFESCAVTSDNDVKLCLSVCVCVCARPCVCMCECMIKSEPHKCIKKVIKNNKENCINFTSLFFSFSRCFRGAFVMFAFSLGVYFYDSYTHKHTCITTACNVNLLQSWVCQLFRITRVQIKCKFNFVLIKCSYKTFKKSKNQTNRTAFDFNIPCT